MKEIKLTRGFVAIVDDEDFEALSGFRWYAQGQVPRVYAARKARLQNGRCLVFGMHRQIQGLELEDEREVDHLNRVTLDNRRDNLRTCTARDNAENRRDQSVYGAGVWRWRSGRFGAVLRVDGKQVCLGTYDTPEEAQEARRTFLKTPGPGLSSGNHDVA